MESLCYVSLIKFPGIFPLPGTLWMEPRLWAMQMYAARIQGTLHVVPPLNYIAQQFHITYPSKHWGHSREHK